MSEKPWEERESKGNPSASKGHQKVRLWIITTKQLYDMKSDSTECIESIFNAIKSEYFMITAMFFYDSLMKIDNRPPQEGAVQNEMHHIDDVLCHDVLIHYE